MDLPTLYLSHGSPTFATEQVALGARLRALGRRLPRPRAVLVVSPHWITHGLRVTAAARPETLHDFSGFPPALYALRYPAPGAPGVAHEVIDELVRNGIAARADESRGFDHGAWVPLMHLYPAADVPVVQLSQPSTPSPLALLELGQAVAPLRERGVLVIGSGSLTHNMADRARRSTPDYVPAFAAWVAARIAEGDLDALLNYRSSMPQAVLAHPTDEHFLPLFFAIGAAGARWHEAERIEGGVMRAVLSMDSFMFSCAPRNHRPMVRSDARNPMETS